VKIHGGIKTYLTGKEIKMEFDKILENISNNCGEDIGRVVSNNAQKLKEADVEVDAGLSEINALKAKIDSFKSIEGENTVLKKQKKDLEKKIKEVDSRELAISHTEEINALKIANSERLVDTLMEFAKIISGKEAAGGSRKKSK